MLSGRLLQGFSAGMELGGVSVYLSEIATPGHKGFYVSWQSGSQQVAVIFAALLGVLLSRALPPEQDGSWGWRVPLLVGCAIIPVLFWLRRSLAETEEFLARRAAARARAQILSSLNEHWKIVLIGTLMVTMTTVSFYMITAYTPTFGGAVLHLEPTDSLLVTLCVAHRISFGFPSWAPVRSGRAPTVALGLHGSVAADCVSGFVWLVSRAILRPAAGSKLWLSFIYRRLQRRDGRLSDGDHAHRSADHRIRSGLQPRHRAVRRLHARDLHLSDSCHSQPSRPGTSAVGSRAARAHRDILGRAT